MTSKKVPEETAWTTIDGNEAVARIAYQVNEVIAIYPITPSSPMGEWADQWASEGKPNLWGTVPLVVEMQSEGGAAGAAHGAMQAGSLTTTFTASQGLLLMIPNMYKIAGELTPSVFHVAARSVAAQALSIFGDHSDVMATRATGWALLASGSVQEAMGFALIAQAATLKSRVPFLHFFDGFRTSHEVNKVAPIPQGVIRAMIDDSYLHAHRARALSPDHPVLRGTAQNPDVFFQAREASNPYYLNCPAIVEEAMEQFGQLTGREYGLFEYTGAEDADRVIAIMGSGVDTVEETVKALNAAGENVGLLKIRLYRPFSIKHLIDVLPPTVKSVAALDRTKEPGSAGEPLYLDLVAAFQEAYIGGDYPHVPKVTGGRYGLSSKEFTPAMVRSIFDELDKDRPKNHFTIGIIDDVTHSSLDYDPEYSIEDPKTVRAVFYGLGADGTVGANKNSIKIIGEETGNDAQGFFVYDSKKSGAVTVSHLRFGPNEIRAPYLISRANFVACHQFQFLEQIDLLSIAEHGGTFLLNSIYGPEEVWDHLPSEVQRQIIEKNLKFFVVDGYEVARETGMGHRINTILQVCFFALSGILPREEAIEKIKQAIQKTYGKRGQPVIDRNYAAVDAALEHLHEVRVPSEVTSSFDMRPPVPADAPQFVQDVTARMIAREGDLLPVSALPDDGTYPTGTTRWEKRNLSLDIPAWDEEICIQCGKCVLVCPHAVIRAKLVDPGLLENAPGGFKSAPARWQSYKDKSYTLQVSAADCTGCQLCVEICPVKNKSNTSLKALNMTNQSEINGASRAGWDFFLDLPDATRSELNPGLVKDVQLYEPLFEFSGACSGCGETPYVKLVSQLFGDRALVANATGCSSIYGGNLPTTPWAVNKAGLGPAWSNSLFEDNAEFGLGMRLTLDKQSTYARELVERLRDSVGEDLADDLLGADQSGETGIEAQRERVARIKEVLEGRDEPEIRDLISVAGALVRKSVWIIGGDGWAYDIGYGGLDHVLASGKDVNILVLDTEVYSNTGGQMSKATPRGAIAKFAAGGKPTAKKDLAQLAMTYEQVYVAQVAMGGNDAQTVKAIVEAEAYPGPSLIIAYSHCIAHGYDMADGLTQQKAAVETGYWPLFRYNPQNIEDGKAPLKLDSKPPKRPLEEYLYKEARFSMLARSRPDVAAALLKLAQDDVYAKWSKYNQLATIQNNGDSR
ncbi:MAG: pyruvate:ferredoxin (flavodoxin) oxidoreductase [Anaerolineales bacterium]|nr:pyruvate:ferredoxin (flavodoxin) oxidoreductase [Anaerolineales bacterium]